MPPLDDEKNSPCKTHEACDKPGRSTGPRTPEGKSRSSTERTGRLEPVVRGGNMNRLTHGCRSESLVLPFEDPAEFEFTLQSWTGAYNPPDPTSATLVYETAKAHWFFERNQKRLHQIEVRLPSDAWLWTEENIKLFNNFSRYKTAAERSFHRAFNALEAHCTRQQDRTAREERAHRAMEEDRCAREERAHRAMEARCAREERAHRAMEARCAREERARAQMAKIELEWLKKKQERAASDLVATQYIDIMGNHCETTTTWLPANEEILKSVEQTGKTPEFVNRYLFFWFGVPPEYEWTNPTHVQRTGRTVGLQRMLYSDWLKVVEKEKTARCIEPRQTILATSREPDAPPK